MTTSTAFNRPAANRFGGRRSVPVAPTPAPAQADPASEFSKPEAIDAEQEQAAEPSNELPPAVGDGGPEPADQPVQPTPPSAKAAQRRQQKAPTPTPEETPVPPETRTTAPDSADGVRQGARLLILDAGQISYIDPSIHVLDLDKVRAVEDPRDIVDVIAALAAVADTDGKATAVGALTDILTTKALAR